MSGNWASKVESPRALSVEPPPSRSSSAPSNCCASSPNRAFSRARKSSADGTSVASLISVWTTTQESQRTMHIEALANGLPPESKSSSEGNLSAIVTLCRFGVEVAVYGSLEDALESRRTSVGFQKCCRCSVLFCCLEVAPLLTGNTVSCRGST